MEEEERKRRTDLELDYLAPFLAQIGDPEKLTRKQAYQLKEDCLADLKQRLIDKANLIQARFEKVCTLLHPTSPESISFYSCVINEHV